MIGTTRRKPENRGLTLASAATALVAPETRSSRPMPPTDAI
jgi:hypothetical protein